MFADRKWWWLGWLFQTKRLKCLRTTNLWSRQTGWLAFREDESSLVFSSSLRLINRREPYMMYASYLKMLRYNYMFFDTTESALRLSLSPVVIKDEIFTLVSFQDREREWPLIRDDEASPAQDGSVYWVVSDVCSSTFVSGFYQNIASDNVNAVHNSFSLISLCSSIFSPFLAYWNVWFPQYVYVPTSMWVFMHINLYVGPSLSAFVHLNNSLWSSVVSTDLVTLGSTCSLELFQNQNMSRLEGIMRSQVFKADRTASNFLSSKELCTKLLSFILNFLFALPEDFIVGLCWISW